MDKKNGMSISNFDTQSYLSLYASNCMIPVHRCDWYWKLSFIHICIKSNNKSLKDLRKRTWCYMRLKQIWCRKDHEDHGYTIWHLLGATSDSQFTCLWSPWPFVQLQLLLRRPTLHGSLGTYIVWLLKGKLELPMGKHWPMEDVEADRKIPSPFSLLCPFWSIVLLLNSLSVDAASNRGKVCIY